MVHWSGDLQIPEDADHDGLEKYKMTGNFGTDFKQGMGLLKVPPHPQIALTIEKRLKALGPDPPKDKQGNVIDEEWTELNLSGWKLDAVSLCVMSKLLPKAVSITTLILVNVDIGMDGIGSLVEFLPNTAVTDLNLDWNSSGAVETKADVYGSRLAGLIGSGSKLISLSLRSNKIGDKGAIALSQTLKTNFKLATLNLFDNDITDQGGKELMKALVHNVALRTLLLGKNKLNCATLNTFTNVLCRYSLGSDEVEERNAIEQQWTVAKKAEGGKKKGKGAQSTPELPPLTKMEESEGKFSVQGNQTLEILNLGHNSIEDDSLNTFCAKVIDEKESLSPKFSCLALQKNNTTDSANAALQALAKEISTEERTFTVFV